MTTEANANPGTADAAAGTQASAADAVKAPVGTPATDQKVAEATAGETPKNGEPVNWEQKATYWEAEAKKIAGQRDAAKKTWLGSDDGKKFAAELASLKTAKTQWEKSQQDKAEAESAQKGEFEKLYQGAKTKSDELTAKVADLEGTATAKEAAWTGRMIRAEAKASYNAMQGSDPELFGMLVDKAVAAGSLSIDGEGNIAGVEAFLKELQEKKPHLFGVGAKGTPTAPGAIGGKPAKAKTGQGVSLFQGPHTGGGG